jgi:transposase
MRLASEPLCVQRLVQSCSATPVHNQSGLYTVATARKMAVLVWHLLTKEADYLWARPALVAQKLRSLELQAGRPMKKGNKRGPAYAYNVKELRDREKAVAEQAEHAYEQLVAGWRDRPGRRRMGAASTAGPS